MCVQRHAGPYVRRSGLWNQRTLKESSRQPDFDDSARLKAAGYKVAGKDFKVLKAKASATHLSVLTDRWFRGR